MIFEIEVNNKIIKARKGESILTTLNNNGIKVPTMCYMPELTPTGNCRICVVEVAGHKNLIPACSHPVEEGMKIKTHSSRVIKARKTIVELLLATHPSDCLFCERNSKCELQTLAIELNLRERKSQRTQKDMHIDLSSPSIMRDMSKCVLCGRCVRICEETMEIFAIDFTQRGNKTSVGPAFRNALNMSCCINCGQCIMVCPTGSLTEKSHIERVQEAIQNEDLHTIAFYSPSVAVSLADEFGLKSGKDMSDLINAALKKIGFRKVFDTGFAIDALILEQTDELLERLNSQERLPLFTSNCPAWIQFVNEFYPEFIDNISTCKSPQQILNTIAKTWYAETYNIQQEKTATVAIMSCTAKKQEAQFDEITSPGIPATDAVLTTRELAKLIRLFGIDINSIEGELSDEPFRIKSSASRFYAYSGGTTEAILRTLNHRLTGKDLIDFKFNENKQYRNRRESKVNIGGRELNIAIVSGTSAARQLMEDLKTGQCKYDFVEVMACSGGCLNGGGQPLNTNEKIFRTRIKTITEADKNDIVNCAHHNTQVNAILDKFFCDNKRTLLHRNYFNTSKNE